MNRIIVNVTSPQTEFTILIPVTLTAESTSFNVYFGTLLSHPIYSTY